MAKKRNTITGQWSARPIEMQRSYAYRVLSRAAHQCLSRIEIELADHGGNDIDALPVTFNDFADYGVHRSAIAPALADLEALGFIDITERGVAARAADYRRHNKFRLLTRPWEKRGASYRPRWERFETLEQALAVADAARKSVIKEKSPVRKPYHGRYGNRTMESKFPSTETVPLCDVGNRTTIYISGDRAAAAFPLPIKPTPTPQEQPVPMNDTADAPTAPETPPDALHALVAKLLWSPPRWVEITPEMDRALNRHIDASTHRLAPIDALTAIEGFILSNALPNDSARSDAVH
jgi:hypothetical protein